MRQGPCLPYAHRQVAAGERGRLLFVVHRHARRAVLLQFEGRLARGGAFVMPHLHADHVRAGRRKPHGEHSDVERVAAAVQALLRRKDGQRIRLHLLRRAPARRSAVLRQGAFANIHQ